MNKGSGCRNSSRMSFPQCEENESKTITDLKAYFKSEMDRMDTEYADKLAAVESAWNKNHEKLEGILGLFKVSHRKLEGKYGDLEKRVDDLELAAKTPQPTPGLAKSRDDPNEAQTRNDDEQQTPQNDKRVNFHISRCDDESYWQLYDFRE